MKEKDRATSDVRGVKYVAGRVFTFRGDRWVDESATGGLEEVAVAPGDVRLLGPLPRVSTLAKYSIQPFLSLWPPGRYGVASPAEVDHVFQVPLAWLAAPANSEETEIALPGGRRLRVPAWLWEGEVIWGATRRITLTLLDLVAALRS